MKGSLRVLMFGCIACLPVAAWFMGCGGSTGLGSFNPPPTVVLSHDYTGTDAPVLVTFTATATDSDGISQYEWDDNFDGTFDVTASGGAMTSIQVNYSGGGTFVVAVIVTDGKGAKTFQSITINIAGNLAPTVSLVANPSSGAPPLSGTLTATASDPDGTITKYEWDLDNDGTYELDTGTTNNTAFNFATDGTYVVRVRVTDDWVPSAMATASTTIIVSSGPINNPPVINNLTATPPSSGTWPVNIVLDVDYTDPDGDTCLVEWDTAYNWATFNPNPTYTGQDPLPVTLSAAGVFDLAVRVSDGRGGVAIRTVRITVGMPRADFYIADATDQLVYNAPGAPIQMDTVRRTEWPTEWPWFTQPNHPIVYACPVGTTLYFKDATTPAGIATEWAWDFGDSIGTSITQNPMYIYNTPGLYQVRLVVNQSGGNWNSQTSVVAVYDPAQNQGVVVHAINEAVSGDAGNYIDSSNPSTTPESTRGLRCYAQSTYGYCAVVKTNVADTGIYPIPSGAAIFRAGLVMSVCRENAVGDDDRVNVYAITVNWQENAVTWNQIIGSPWAQPLASAVGADLANSYCEVTPYNYSPENEQRPYKALLLDITTLVQAWLGGTVTNYGCLITLNNRTPVRSGALTFMNSGKTSDYTSHYLEPVMVIIYDQ